MLDLTLTILGDGRNIPAQKNREATVYASDLWGNTDSIVGYIDSIASTLPMIESLVDMIFATFY